MQPRVTRHLVVSVSVALATAGMSAQAMAQEGSDAGGITTIAAGLTNPRGFDWGPDDALYLAQAGHGGDNNVALVPAFGPDAGVGQGWLAAVDISNGPVSFAGFEPDTPTCA